MLKNPEKFNASDENVKPFNTLTADWKAGNINQGYFYVKTTLGKILIDNIDFYRPNYDGFYHKVSEVITHVPDYDHFVGLTEKVKTLTSENKHISDLLANQGKEVENLREEIWI